MKKEQFNALCNNQYIILDGATGSNLMKAGMPIGVCPEQWILEHPQTLVDLQKSYVAAGTHILYAPTFTANRVKLQEYGLYEKQESIINGLVDLSKQAAQGKAYIAGDITMTGKQLAPIGAMKTEELIAIYKEQISLLEKAGVDLLIIETMMSLAETRAAVIAAKEVSELPIMVTMSFEQNGKTLFGTDAKTAAVVLESLGVDALGVNCSTGPKDMAKVIREIAAVTALPLIAKPNAGLPKVMPDGSTGYDMSPETFAEEVTHLLEAGATILGGCCGTDPRYIEELSVLLKDRPLLETARNENNVVFLASERNVLQYSETSSNLCIGTKIDAGIYEEIAEELADGYTDTILELAQDQEDDDVDIININLHGSDIDEESMMIQVLEDLQTITNMPLSFSYTTLRVLETALRCYPGKALVLSGELTDAERLELINLTNKYGALIRYNR